MSHKNVVLMVVQDPVEMETKVFSINKTNQNHHINAINIFFFLGF